MSDIDTEHCILLPPSFSGEEQEDEDELEDEEEEDEEDDCDDNAETSLRATIHDGDAGALLARLVPCRWDSFVPAA